MKPKTVRLPNARIWLRVASPTWDSPLDPSYARNQGGRWNPPLSYPTLYLNADVVTARLQIERMLAGYPVALDDLDDEAYVLVAATLPNHQTCADAVSADGLQSLGLPQTYPLNSRGGNIAHERCQPVGKQARHEGLRGVWCKSACTSDGQGRELAWFPATSRAKARPVWAHPLPLGAWASAVGWKDLRLEDQPNPRVSARLHRRRRPGNHPPRPVPT